MQLNCIFCKIIKQETASWTIYQDDLVQAFLDINPVSLGHTLIIPKEHFQDIYDTPAGCLARSLALAQKLAQVYKKLLKPKGINLFHSTGKQAGQVIFHFHLHLIPRYTNDGLKFKLHHQVKKNINLEKLFQKIKKNAAHLDLQL